MRRAVQRLSRRLAASEISAYKDKGFYVVPDAQLSFNALQNARAGLEDLLARNKQVLPEQLVSAHLSSDLNGSTVAGVPAFMDLVKSDPLVDLAADILDTDNIICWGCQVFCKLPGSGRAVPFHQDGQYWPIEPLETVTVWVALDDSDRENGGLWYVPGSHKKGYLNHVREERDDSAISFVLDPNLLSDLPDPEPAEIPAGGVSLHDPVVLHGSKVNRSTRRRAGVAIHYMPSRCWFRRDIQTLGEKLGGIKLDYSNRPLVLVRGVCENSMNEHVLEL
eukprot:TRINITY_DN27263_c0_g5_i1.p1 TRINITY_DN27263_c0_g5~~TRINITY_DN27263_c0_g5_i1.p1  ORF type:complete len:278 (-),score=24.30 TRINITY_DN27263_c0_g5_i1:102-935(-)